MNAPAYFDPNRLLVISDLLKDLRTQRAELEFSDWKLAHDAEARKINMTPPTGWEGKNEETRRAAAAQAFAADPALQAIDAQQVETKQKLLSLNETIEGLCDERRAVEYMIRDRLTSALESGNVNNNHRGPADQHAFENVADQAADRRATGEVVWSLADSQPAEDDLPF